MRLLDAERSGVSVRSERGVSLVASLLILAIFSVSGTSALYFSTRAARHADLSSESKDAVALAESGMNFARSTLWQASDPTDASAVPLQQVAMEGGTVQYWGTYDAGTTTWTLTGVSTVANPSGQDAIRGAFESKVLVTTGGGASATVWDFSFSMPGACMTIAQNSILDSPMKVDGDMCIEENGHLTGDTLEVSGTLTVGNNGSVGSAATPITAANLPGGCTGGSPDPHSCGPSDDVYVQTLSEEPFGFIKPVPDWAYWYQNASPGPMSTCTVGSFPGGFDDDAPAMNKSRPTVQLTPDSPYDCQTATGRIAWTPGSPGTLTIDGTIFFDGNLETQNNDQAVYQGKATIYVNGGVNVANNSELCAVSGCGADWDTTQNALVFVAHNPGDTAFRVSNNAKFQGGAILEGDYELVNNAENWGPVISDNFLTQNNGGSFVPISGTTPGMPDLNSGGGSGGGTSPTLENIDGTFHSYAP